MIKIMNSCCNIWQIKWLYCILTGCTQKEPQSLVAPTTSLLKHPGLVGSRGECRAVWEGLFHRPPIRQIQLIGHRAQALVKGLTQAALFWNCHLPDGSHRSGVYTHFLYEERPPHTRAIVTRHGFNCARPGITLPHGDLELQIHIEIKLKLSGNVVSWSIQMLIVQCPNDKWARHCYVLKMASFALWQYTVHI